MFGYRDKRGATPQVAEVKVTPKTNPPAFIPLERRVARVKRIRASLEQDPNHPKKLILQAELDAHLEALLEHKAALEDMLTAE